MPVLKQLKRSERHSVRPPALIICCEAPPNVASTNSTTTVETVSQLTVI